jgi:hypothetical protein
MLPDPVTIAANSPTPSIVWGVIRSDGYGTERIDTGANGYGLVINHTPNAKTGNRHYLRITQTKDATDPYTGLTRKVSASVSVAVSDAPFGFTSANLVDLVELAIDTLNDSEVTITKFVGMQS